MVKNECNWKVVSLNDLIEIKHGFGFKGEYFSEEDNGFVVVTPGNFKIGGGFQKQTKIFYDSNYPSQYNLKCGDLIVSMTDLSKESDTLGTPAIIPKEHYQYLHNQRIGLVKLINTDVIDKEFLYYILRSDDYHKLVVSTAAGSTVKHTSPTRIKEYKFLIPPMCEQRKIAKALFDIDKLIVSLEKLIEKKSAIKQGVMQELLTGKTRIDGFSKKWDRGLIGEFCDIYRGGSPRPIQNYLTNKANGVNWIKIGDVSRNAKYIESTKEKINPEGKRYSRVVHSGDFLLSNSMSFGRPYILKIDGCIHDGWLVIQNYSKFFNTEYLYYMLMSPFVIDQYLSKAAGSSVLNLNKELVSTVEVLIPELKEQEEIAGILATFDNEINSLELKLEKYRQIKQGMMQELLTGRIRLL